MTGPVAASAGGADLGVGDLVVAQGVELGGFGGGVAEAAADGKPHGEPPVMHSYGSWEELAGGLPPQPRRRPPIAAWSRLAGTLSSCCSR